MGPRADAQVPVAHLHHPAAVRHQPLGHPFPLVVFVQPAKRVPHVQEQHAVRAAQDLPAPAPQRVGVGQVQPATRVHHGRCQELRQFRQSRHGLRVTAQKVRHDHRPAGFHQPVAGPLHRPGVRPQPRVHRPGGIGESHLPLELLLLESHVVAKVHGASGFRARHPVAPGEGLHHRVHPHGLVVPLHEVPDRGALQEGGVIPVDPGTPQGHVRGAGGAQHQHRHAVQKRLVDPHAAVQQPHHVVEHRGHGPARDPGVAVRDAHRDLLVRALHDFRAVAAVVDEGVVQPAEAAARVQAHVGNAEPLQQIHNEVRDVLPHPRLQLAPRSLAELEQLPEHPLHPRRRGQDLLHRTQALLR
ncbi:hypothetical protein HRbin31_00270 [bacterium HR31]|nr:hypothetical protein HRbin31_00270 [bacterium HR31]